MATAIEQPPQPNPGLGCCLGKGCLILIVFFFFLFVVFCVGAYLGLRTFTSNKPRELPQVQTSEAQQQEALQRWDNFENAVHEIQNGIGRRQCQSAISNDHRAESARDEAANRTNGGRHKPNDCR